MSTKEDLDKAVSEAYAALSRAEKIADELEIEFEFSPAYGMGGWYCPASCVQDPDEVGWNPSSHSC